MADQEPEMLQFEIVRHVTLPLFKLEQENYKYYFQFKGPIVKGDELTDGDGKERKAAEGKEKMPPPDIAEVVNLRTGELGQIIVNAVVKSNLQKKYPNDGYVDKWFQITRLKSVTRGSRTIKMFEIIEIKAASKDAKTAAKK